MIEDVVKSDVMSKLEHAEDADIRDALETLDERDQAISDNVIDKDDVGFGILSTHSLILAARRKLNLSTSSSKGEATDHSAITRPPAALTCEA